MRDAGRLSLSTLPHQDLQALEERGGDSAAAVFEQQWRAALDRARSLDRRAPEEAGRHEAARTTTPIWPAGGPTRQAASAGPPQQCRRRPRPRAGAGRRSRAHLDLEDELGGYEAADARAEATRGRGEDLGQLIGAGGRNIALTQNSTTAFAQALATFDFAAGDVILTSRADYASNQIMYLSLARRLGVEVVRAPDLAGGRRGPATRSRELVRRRRPTLVR